MCISAPKAPDVPTIPERQATKLPDDGATDAGTLDRIRRRRGMYATILTQQAGGGTLGAPRVTKAAGG